MQGEETGVADVAVIGLGGMGSAALWRTASRGARVVAFEQFVPGHDLGSSHGESRIIRTAYAEGADYVPLIRRPFPLWQALEEESGVSLLTMTGSLMIGRPKSELVHGAIASLRAHGLAHEVLDAVEMAGFLRPEAAIAAVDRAERLGATVHRQTTVEAVEIGADGARIRAGGTTYQARHVIVAARA